jgi:hypothetical protein
MKPFLLTAVACLSALSFYLWTETDSLQSRAKQDAAALQNAQREAAEANTQLAEKNRQLESTQAALETANAQLAQTRTALPNRSDSDPPSSDPSAPGASPFIKNLVALAQKAADLDRRFKAFPELDIPEIALLTESDWISIASQDPKLETVDQIRTALERLVSTAKQNAMAEFRTAVWSAKRKPEPIQSLEALKPHLPQKLTVPMLERYELLSRDRIEAGWMEQPRIQQHLREAHERGARIDFVIREKEVVGKSQNVTVFYLPAEAGSAKNSSSMPSSLSFLLDRSDVSPARPRN